MDGKPREPGMAWASRVTRGWRLDRNPVRRASDRAETLWLTVLLLTFLAVAPLAALATGAWAHAAAHRAGLAQQASRRQVEATVLLPSAGATAWGSLTADQPARWTAPDGTRVTRQLTVPADAQAGDTLAVWTTHDGQLAPHPMNDFDVTWFTVGGEAAGVASLAVALSLGGLLAHWSLNQRRLAAWGTAWRSAGPRWTTRA